MAKFFPDSFLHSGRVYILYGYKEVHQEVHINGTRRSGNLVVSHQVKFLFRWARTLYLFQSLLRCAFCAWGVSWGSWSLISVMFMYGQPIGCRFSTVLSGTTDPPGAKQEDTSFTGGKRCFAIVIFR